MSENTSSGDEYEAARHILGLDDDSIDPKILEVQLGMATLAILQNKTNELASQLSAEIDIDQVPEESKEDFIYTIKMMDLLFTTSGSHYLDGVNISIRSIGTIVDSGTVIGYRITLFSKMTQGQYEMRAIYVVPEMPTVISDHSGETMREEEFHRERNDVARTIPDMYDPEVIRYLHDRKDQGLGIRTLGIADAAVFTEMLQSSTLDMKAMRDSFGVHTNE